MGRNQRIALLAIAVAIVVIGIVVIGGSSDSKDTKTTAGPQTITVVNGRPAGGIKKLVYDKGDTIDLTVASDTADEIHIHGYDLHKDVTKGGQVHFSFPATIDGRFEIELEDAKQQLASLQVQP